ncbi:MAG: universal stress protein [Gammaproteobacteria bacterium]|nr:universal stress protein [Gammaproteobacteria bacterium]
MATNKILIALNQSPLSLKVLPSVEQLFSTDSSELILYYVTKPPGAAGFGEPDLSAGYQPLPGDQNVLPTLHPIYESQQRDSIKSHVKTELMPVTQRLREAGYKVEVKVGFNKDPVDAIKRYTRETNASLIAMSTMGRVGVTRFFFRNMANTLAQEADIPVLLVHPREE